MIVLNPAMALAGYASLAIGVLLILRGSKQPRPFPLVWRHRVDHLERELKYKAIALEAKDRAYDNLNDQLTAAQELSENLRQDYVDELDRNNSLRKEFAGDLQLERTRYDEFVRDTMERVLGTPRAIPAVASQREAELPTVIQAAIEEVSFGNSSLESHLESEARRRLQRQEKPDEIAEKIKAGERPD